MHIERFITNNTKRKTKYKTKQLCFLIAAISSGVKDINVSSSHLTSLGSTSRAAQMLQMHNYKTHNPGQHLGFNISKLGRFIPSTASISPWVLVWEVVNKTKLLVEDFS